MLHVDLIGINDNMIEKRKNDLYVEYNKKIIYFS